MMSSGSPLRIAIAGASSLRGKEVAALIEEHLPSAELRLLDDEVVEGVLTEAAGEPAILQAVNEDTLEGCRFVLFAGEPEFTRRHWQQAMNAGATVIDMSGALRAEPAGATWIPALRTRLAPPQPPSSKRRLYLSPSAPVLIACTLAAALQQARVERLAIVFFQPVSERGQPGIEELEKQTVSLLSLKPITQEFYGAQVAFNLLGSYGADGQQTLAAVRAEITQSVAAYLDGRLRIPSIQLVQAPVFHGCAFSAFVDGSALGEPAMLERALEDAGIKIARTAEDAPSNAGVAGESQIVVARIERDSQAGPACWIWGAGDNLRLAAANAVSIVETLLAS